MCYRRVWWIVVGVWFGHCLDFVVIVLVLSVDCGGLLVVNSVALVVVLDMLCLCYFIVVLIVCGGVLDLLIAFDCGWVC